MADSPRDYRKYLNPKVLAKIGGLALRARLVVEGYYAGMHRSPYRGASVEFADYRIYTQSDDIKHIDWKVYGRTDKHYVKEYEQETNLNCILAVDCSESMTYRSEAAVMTKHEYATCVAASLAYLALRQQDAVGLALFDERITRFLRPSNNPRQWKVVIDELEETQSRGLPLARTSLRPVLDDLAERVGGALVVVISDLFDDPAEILGGLQHLRYRRNDVIVCNVWDPDERRFPYRGPTLFDGLERSGRLLTEPRLLCDRYLEEVERFTSALRAGCLGMQVDYALFETTTDLSVALSAYLGTRGARIRQRTSRVRGRG